MNYFELFGLDTSFNLDTRNLSETYQKLQKAVHPDRFAHASSQEQLIAVQKSAMINDANQTLKKPLKRAEYLLEIRNTVMPNEQASFSDNSFLMRQMELREMLEEVKYADDVYTAIFEATQILDQEYELLFSSMQIQLGENTQESNLSACDNLRKLKFYEKLHIELDRLEEQLLDD
ncbi:MAG: co-chaperone HscB [Alteromonadaceae bacterium]|nr:co-chaperone HscB [Alteromonadaceae bacterium]